MNRTDLISGTAPATGTLDSTHALQADAAHAPPTPPTSWT